MMDDIQRQILVQLLQNGGAGSGQLPMPQPGIDRAPVGQTNGMSPFSPENIDALARQFGGGGGTSSQPNGMYDTRLSPVTPPADYSGMYDTRLSPANPLANAADQYARMRYGGQYNQYRR